MALFPGAIPVFAGFTPGHTLVTDNHAAQHNLEQAEIVQVATKVGTGASVPAANQVLTGNGAGTSAWSQVNLTTMVSGILPVVNGGTGTTSTTGTGPVVYGTAPTIATPVLTTPTIADFTGATHTHANNAGGGQLNGANAISDGTLPSRKVALSIVGADGSTLNPLPTSLTDITGSSSTFTLSTNSYLYLTVSSTIQNNTTTDVFMYLNVDGVDDARYIWVLGVASNSIRSTNSRTWKLSLNAGSHTIKLRVIATTGTSAVAYDPSWFALVISQ